MTQNSANNTPVLRSTIISFGGLFRVPVLRVTAVGKTVKFQRIDSDLDDSDTFWNERVFALEQAKQRSRIKRMARQAVHEKASDDSDWQSEANHFLWDKRAKTHRRSR